MTDEQVPGRAHSDALEASSESIQDKAGVSIRRVITGQTSGKRATGKTSGRSIAGKTVGTTGKMTGKMSGKTSGKTSGTAKKDKASRLKKGSSPSSLVDRWLDDALVERLHENTGGCVDGRDKPDRILLWDAARAGAASIGVLDAEALTNRLINGVRAYGYEEEDDFGLLGDDLRCAFDGLKQNFVIRVKLGPDAYGHAVKVPIESVRDQMLGVQKMMEQVRQGIFAAQKSAKSDGPGADLTMKRVAKG